MGVIKKIEIWNFRSIEKLVLEGDQIGDLNVFVGKNDIGKSNILRALNLFFNGETEIGSTFDFEQDFYKNKRGIPGKGQYVQIRLTIDVLYENEKHIVWNKRWNNNGLLENTRDWRLYDNNGNESGFITSSRAPRWLTERLIFRYVPAIKSPKYFEHLYAQLHDTLSSTYSQDFSDGTNQLIEKIQAVTEDITTDLEKQLGLRNKLGIPTDLKAFFASLDFSTEINGQIYHLNQRGDGIKSRHIPVILKFIADNAAANTKGSIKVTTIWGYEEPENNLEMSHAFELAELFAAYSKKIQTFITTHSPAFYSLKKQKGTGGGIVIRSKQDTTTLLPFNTTEVNIDNEMGVLQYITPFVEAVNKDLKDKEDLVKKLRNNLEDLNINAKLLVFTEDSSDDLKMIKTVLESNGANLDETDFQSFSGAENLRAAIYSAKYLRDKFRNLQAIIFHLDRDVNAAENLREWYEKGMPDNSFLFITPGYDLEAFFLNPNHINLLHSNISLAEVQQLIQNAIDESKEKSLEKLANGYHNSLSASDMANPKKSSPSACRKEANAMFESDPILFCHGKSAMASLKSSMRQKIKPESFDPYRPSEHLKVSEIETVINQIWGTAT